MLGEAASNDEVCPLLELVEQGGQGARLMLPVTIELRCSIVAIADGISKSGPQSPANTEVEGEAGHANAVRFGHLGRPVARAIINDQHVTIRGVLRERTQHCRQCSLFIQCRDDDECADWRKLA